MGLGRQVTLHVLGIWALSARSGVCAREGLGEFVGAVACPARSALQDGQAGEGQSLSATGKVDAEEIESG